MGVCNLGFAENTEFSAGFQEIQCFTAKPEVVKTSTFSRGTIKLLEAHDKEATGTQ
jgi:hypothetical protein